MIAIGSVLFLSPESWGFKSRAGTIDFSELCAFMETKYYLFIAVKDNIVLKTDEVL